MKISIIMPVYNAEHFLKRSIDSVLKQSFCDWELLIVDDGSTDESASICRSYIKKDPRIRLFGQKHKGQAAARNVGLKNASGEYIAFLDADDCMHVNMLEVLYENINSTDADIAVVDFTTDEKELFAGNRVKTDTHQELVSLNAESRNRKEIQRKANVYLWNKLYKKALFKHICFPEKRFYEDAAVMHLLFERANYIVWDPRKLYFYFRNPTGTVNQLSLKKVKDCLWAYKQRIAFYYQKGYLKDLEHATHVYLYKAYELYGQVVFNPKKKLDAHKYIRKTVKCVFTKYDLEKMLPLHGRIRYKTFVFFPLLFDLYTKLKKIFFVNAI